MKILAANLKHFYQCRGLWWFYFYLLFMAFMLARIPLRNISARAGSFIAIAGIIIGVLVAGMQRDVLSKPFSFCMPNHRSLPRRLIFGMGGITSLLLGVLVFGYPEFGSPHLVSVVLAASFFGMVAFLLGVCIVFLTRSMVLLGYVWVLFIVAPFFDLKNLLTDMIIFTPLRTIAAGILICGIAWKWLGRESLAREYCGKFVVGLSGFGNMARNREYQKRKAAKRLAKKGSAISERREEFFLPRMEACRQFSRERYIVGNIYIMSEKILGPWWQIHVLMVIVLFLSMGYFPSFEESPFEISFFLFACPAFLLVAADLIPYRNALLPAGRIEKFHNTLAMCFGGTVLLTLLIAALMAASYPLSVVMPDITWKGEALLPYHAVSPGKFYLCLALSPITMTLGTLFSRKNSSFIISMMIMWAVVMAVVMGRHRLMFLWPGEAPAAIILVAASWIGSFLLLLYHCRKQDLVGQGR